VKPMTGEKPFWQPGRLLQVLGALALAAVVWLAVPQPARADWSVVGDTVPAGQVIDNDVLARGTDVVIEGTINGDLLAVGSTVTVNGSVSGSLVTLARTVTVNGQVGGSVYVASRTLTLGSAARVVHNAHYLGLMLDSQSGSQVGRDLVVASVRGRVSSQIGRALNAAILLLTFNGQIGAGVEAPGDGAALPDGVEPGGTLLFVGSSAGRPLGLAAPALSIRSLQQEQEPVPGLPEGLVQRLGDLAALLLVGGLALWLRPILIRRPAERLLRQPLPAAGYGLLALFIVPGALAIGILLAVLLFFLGMWLGGVALWELAFLLWGIGYPILILAFSLFALAVLYGTKVIVADLVGKRILRRLAPRSLDTARGILPLLLGLVLYVLVRSIPFLGLAVEVVVTVLGLGALWLALRLAPAPAPAPAALAQDGDLAVEADVVSLADVGG
jgi:cytoskeletal protein CcmA (bactofilin family)